MASTQNTPQEPETVPLPHPDHPLPWEVFGEPGDWPGIDAADGLSVVLYGDPNNRDMGFRAPTSEAALQTATYAVHTANNFPALLAERDALLQQRDALAEALRFYAVDTNLDRFAYIADEGEAAYVAKSISDKARAALALLDAPAAPEAKP